MNTKRVLALVLALMMTLTLFGCGEKPAEDGTDDAPKTVTITDMIGRQVEIVPGSYQRVVCIGAGALRLYSYVGDVSLFQCGQELSSDDVQHSEDPPVDPTHPICKNCGASNTADAKFCHQCGQELSSKAEDPEQKSDDDLGKDALAFGAGLLDESAAKTRNDTVCPFCGEPACHPLQKNETTVTNKSYGWGSGCCGMLLLGPFGLLCGLCGKGSKVESKSELWWVCKKCGKAHIALVDALKKWEIATDGIYGSAVAAAIVLIVAKYLFSFGILAYIMAAVPALGLATVHSEISKELGEPLINFLTPEQKKDCLSSIAIATVIVIALGLFGVPLLNSWLGD